MVPDAIDERQLSSVAQALLKSVSELASDPDKRLYAVMDGSQFKDLPRLLKQADISHRPLYRYAGGDYTVIVGGPWLVDPYQTAAAFDERWWRSNRLSNRRHRRDKESEVRKWKKRQRYRRWRI